MGRQKRMDNRRVGAWRAVLCLSTAIGLVLAPISYAGTISYTYDSLGRVRSVTYADGSTVNYTHDQAGNRVQVVRAALGPSAVNDAISTPYQTAKSFDPRTNDTDPNGFALSVSGVGTAAHGTVSFTGSSVTYTPAAGYSGADSFTYTIGNGHGGTATATVNVTVSTSAPTVSAVSMSVAYNSATAVGLLPSGVYTSLTASTLPGHGTLSAITGTSVTYTPTTGYLGADSFTYTATGLGGNSAPATVSLTVQAPAAPTVGAVSLATLSNAAGTATLTPSGLYSSLAVPTAPAHGTASISGTTATFTPAANYVGADSFTYTATGPGGTSAPATVSVTVGARAPVANADSVTTPSSTALAVTPLSNDTDPQAQVLSVASVTVPVHGTASLVGNTVTYTPAANYIGADSFTYVARNTSGVTANGTVNVTVSARNPVANADSYATAYNTSTTVDPRSNDTDPQGQGVSIVAVGAAGHGTVVNSGTSITYTPTAGYIGADAFSYTIQNASGLQAASTVNMTVNAPAAPTVGAVALSTSSNTAGTATLIPSGVYTSLGVATTPAHGTASIAGTTATYTPTAGYSGADTFTYTATGPGGTSAPATVSVTVQAPVSVSVSVSSTSYNSTRQFKGTIKSTSAVTATASGGVGALTYSWEYVSGDTGITTMSPTSATTRWNDGTFSLSAIYRCKVTDSQGHVGYSPNVTVTFVDNSGL